jgi:hypothetical protein
MHIKKRLSRYVNKIRDAVGLEGEGLDEAGLEDPKFLVVGPPRGGFTLLISVLINLMAYKRWRRYPIREELQRYIPEASEAVHKATEDYFRKHINLDDLMVSGEFQLLLGGPKWLSKENSELCSIRKYIGIKGMGDMTLVISIPKSAMDFHEIVHSHYSPAMWLEDDYFRGHKKFASVRNPLDILTSSLFSLNALTSEYIQRCYPDRDHMVIREELALPKLTDPKIVGGIMAHYLDYFREFITVKDRYMIMSWEDLITEPEKTIRVVAQNAGIEIPDDAPAIIWDRLSYKNLMEHHKHNFWRGRIGNWKEYLVNEHLEAMKQKGVDEILEALGHDKIQYLDESNYTPLQKTVAEHLAAGKASKFEGDETLWTFAFQKSNIQWNEFDFKSLPGTTHVKVERTTIQDEQFLGGLIDAVDKALAPVNETLTAIHKKTAR